MGAGYGSGHASSSTGVPLTGCRLLVVHAVCCCDTEALPSLISRRSLFVLAASCCGSADFRGFALSSVASCLRTSQAAENWPQSLGVKACHKPCNSHAVVRSRRSVTFALVMMGLPLIGALIPPVTNRFIQIIRIAPTW